jgi:hypothetical protein
MLRLQHFWRAIAFMLVLLMPLAMLTQHVDAEGRYGGTYTGFFGQTVLIPPSPFYCPNIPICPPPPGGYRRSGIAPVHMVLSSLAGHILRSVLVLQRKVLKGGSRLP